MQIYSNGKDRVLTGQFPARFKLKNGGVDVPFVRTGRNSIRLSGDIPFGELVVEEIIRKKAPQPAKLGAESLAIINKSDFDKIDILNKKLAINQEQMNAHLSALTEQEATLANLETQNARSIDQTNLNMVEMAKAFGKEIQSDRDSLLNVSSDIKQSLSETAEVLNTKLQAHEVAKNPHKITKATVGLDAVDNTSDLDKPVSKATQKALDKKADKTDIENLDKRLLDADKKQDTLMRNLETVNLYGGVGGNELPEGGKKGQILAKKSKKTGDYEWIDNSSKPKWGDIGGNINNQTDLKNSLDEKQNVIEDLDTIRSDAQAGKDASDTIATYGDIVTHDVDEFATSAQGALADTAVQPDDLATVATTGSYEDLIDKPTIGNATLTIQKNGTNVDTFTANATSNKTINITVPTQASDVNALPDSTKYGSSITVSLNTTDYKMTTTLKDQDGNTLGTEQVIDLPLESVVVNGSYDSTNKKIVLTLQNGSTIDVPVGDLISGLQSTITGGATTITDNDLTVSKALISNSSGKVAVSTVTSTELGYVSGVTSAIQTQINGKVPTSRTVNGKALSSDISLTASDVGAQPSGNYVTTDTAQDITETKTFKAQQRIQSGSSAGCLIIGADSGNTTLTNNMRKLGRMGFPTNENINLNCAFASCDTQSVLNSDIENSVEFGGRPGDQTSTSPDVLNFTVAKTHNTTTPAQKIVALFINKSEANFAVQPKYSSANLATETWVGNQGYITGINSSMVTTALGYTPYDSSNPSGYTTNVGTVTSVNNTSPDGNGNVSLTIPTVNNATLTIQENGSSLGTFTANASVDKTINVTVPTQASDIGAVEANTAITGDTKCKITYDSKGLVTAGADLQASDIPSLTLSKISDVTSSASELNILDGATLTTTELNYVDGVTSSIQTQLDNKVPTSRTVNGKALSSNINLTASDVGALTNNSPSSTSIAIGGTTSYQGTEYDQCVGIGIDVNSKGNNNVVIGYYAQGGTGNDVVIGRYARATSSNGIAIGVGAISQGNQAYQFGPGTNSTLYSLQVGFYINGSNLEYRLLDGTTGKIPVDRYITMSGADGTNAGTTGAVPAPTATDNTKFLRGDGSWASITIPTVNDSTITITQGGVTKGSFTLNQSSGATIALDAGGGGSLPSQTGNAGKYLTTDGTDASWAVPKTHNLFDFMWRDSELNDQSWLRADTFSWQDGTVYSDAYNHLVADISGKTATSETIGSYTISYYLADDGHKITTDETTVANIYNESGVAWYYVLDTVNTRFKLPRTKYGFTGLRDVVGKYVPETLPNVTGTMGKFSPRTTNNISYSGAFVYEQDGSYNVNTTGTSVPLAKASFDASLVSSTYQNSAPVQQRSTQMYLYFYVGEFSQSATEQTAGLNSSLFNGKVDLNAQNLSAQGKSLISGLGMPSSTYEDLTLGASGTTYTAPANGWVYFKAQTTSSTNYQYGLYNVTNTLESSIRVNANGVYFSVYIPVKSGDTFKVTYEANVSNETLRFIYAEGE